jgi:autotransporter-associated beta strand protein
VTATGGDLTVDSGVTINTSGGANALVVNGVSVPNLINNGTLNTGTTGGSAIYFNSTDSSVDITNNGSMTSKSGIQLYTPGTVTNNNYMLGTDRAITLQSSASGSAVINNASSTINGNYSAISNRTSLTSIYNGAGATLWGIYGIENLGTIGTVTNYGSIQGRRWSSGNNAIGGSGSITNLLNYGTIVEGWSGAPAIGSSVTNLVNAQGQSSGALTIAHQPTSYSIFINSPTSFGQLSIQSVTGSMGFDVYAGSTITSGYFYSGVLSGIAAGSLSNTTGVFGSTPWHLSLESSSSTVWDLCFGSGACSATLTSDILSGHTYSSSDLGSAVNPKFDGGTLQIASSGTVATSLGITSNNGVIDQAGLSSNFTGTISDDSAGHPGKLTITNSGTGGSVTLSGTNTYTGGTEVDAGANLTIAGGGALGTGPLALVGSAKFSTTATTTIGNAVSVSGGPALNVASGTRTTITSPIANGTATGSLALQGGGTLILDGVNTYTGGTTVSDGTLEIGDASHATASVTGDVTVGGAGTLAGHGTIGGSVANSAGGTVAPGGTIGTLSVSGNYAQGSSSTLSIEVSPTAASRLNVTGTATLAGTLKLVYDPGVYSRKTYDILHAGNIAGAFSTVHGTAPSGFTQSLSYGATDVDLALDPAIVAPTTDTVFGALGDAALGGGQDANAGILGHLAGLGRTAGAGPRAEVNSIQSRLPLQLAFDGNTQQLGALVAGLPERMAQIGGWFQGIGTLARFNGGAAPGFTTQSGGFLAGIDRPVARRMVAGIAFGYSHTDLTVHDGESATLDTPRLMIYGGYELGDWALGGAVGYAYDRIRADRSIASLGETASSTHSGHEATAAVQATTRLALGRIAIVPAAGLEYVHLYETGFTESGAPGFDLQVASRNSGSLRPFIGIEASEAFTTAGGTVWTPEADLKYSHELFNTPPSLVQVGGGSFSVGGLAPSRDAVTLGGGITGRLSDRLALFADYHATLPTGNFLAQTVTAGLTYRF